MRIVLLGPPGAGKGTQAQFLADYYRIPRIATGDILRQAITEKSELGQVVEHIIGSGRLVPDDIVIALVKNRIADFDCQAGYLLDGFPRTIQQADALRDAHIVINAVIEIDVPDEEIISRITGRFIHPRSGRVYHMQYYPPKVSGQDDQTGEALIQRADDREETVRARLRVYHRDTQPLIAYYREAVECGLEHIGAYTRISGIGSVDEVRTRILKYIKQHC